MTEDQNSEQEFNLDLIDKAFDEKYSQNDIPNPLMEEQEKPKKVDVKNPVEDREEDDAEEEVEDKPTEKKAKESKNSENKEESELKQAYSKLEKSYKDTQKAFHEDRKKLSAYRRAVQSMVDEGILTEEESQTLMDHTKFEGSVDVATSNNPQSSNLIKYANIWEKELEYMRRYSTNTDDIDQNIRAFQHLYDTSSRQEKEAILEDLSYYEDDEVELTKQMLLMGSQHNSEIYSDISDAGGVKKLKEKYSKEIEILQKKLDKTEKQYIKLKQKYEDYNEPTSITVSGGSSDGRSSKSDTFSGASDIDAALNWAYGGRR